MEALLERVEGSREGEAVLGLLRSLIVLPSRQHPWPFGSLLRANLFPFSFTHFLNISPSGYAILWRCSSARLNLMMLAVHPTPRWRHGRDSPTRLPLGRE
jgi:hypothetical protein